MFVQRPKSSKRIKFLLEQLTSFFKYFDLQVFQYGSSSKLSRLLTCLKKGLFGIRILLQRFKKLLLYKARNYLRNIWSCIQNGNNSPKVIFWVECLKHSAATNLVLPFNIGLLTGWVQRLPQELRLEKCIQLRKYCYVLTQRTGNSWKRARNLISNLVYEIVSSVSCIETI